jgi:hypothetical protein
MITDFVLSLDGVTTFRRPDFSKDFEIRGTEAYFKRRAQLKQERQYFLAGVGASDGKIEPVRDSLISQMKQLAGGSFQKAGVLCIFGSSNGAAHALGLAAALQNELTVNYICLADLPLFVSGRSPAIPGTGAMIPSAPVTIRRAHSLAGFIEVHAEGDRPRVSLDRDINAKVKQNFYQHSGNTIRVGFLSGRWRWASDMKNEEFHGVIANAGWNDDQELVVKANPGFFENNGDVFHRTLDDHVTNNIWAQRWPLELAKI